MNRYLVYALVMFTMTSCSSWTRMFAQPGWTSSSGGSSWSSHTGGGGGSYGGGSGGGGHK